ncbi:CBF/Mak21 family-domain-containing protein [Absidia repens]|uniref:CBF/Mak21 family-domain-containing protein n=1 Tax=Absidia repens TaxID=90262 RepID=A0A1X2IMV7_9FUNG|nr:CBF/Mak21 family-domain-containing protein [Absidia repens]
MPPSMKRKRESNKPADFKEARQQIRTLEAGLNDKSNLNNVIDLMTYTQPQQPPKTIHAAIHALHRVFTNFLLQGELQKQSLAVLATADTQHQQKKKKAKSAMEKYQEEKSVGSTKEVVSPEVVAASKVTLWLREQYKDFLQALRTLLDNDEPGLQLPALTILMALLKTETEANQRHGKLATTFANNLFGPVVNAMLSSSHFQGPLQKEFAEKYVNVYDDVRFYFYKDCAEIVEKALAATKDQSNDKQGKGNKRQKLQTQRAALHQLLVNAFSVAEQIQSMPTDNSELDDFWALHPNTLNPAMKKDNDTTNDDKDDMDDLLGGSLSDVEDDDNDKDTKKQSPKKLAPLLQLSVHKKSFTNAWLAILKLPLTEEYYRRTLLIMHKRILPHLSDPRLLMDFLTDAYNAGGAISLLALNGIFTLITEHNLDYPDFYSKLYTLLDRNLLHMKYRSRFFRLLELFLSSAYLPAALIAAFIKRLARLSLTAPPAASVIVVPFIYNMLKRHPTCMKMIHSSSAPTDDATDPYDITIMDPYHCHAIDSSLWELQTLSQHYYANVSTLAKIFTEQFLKPKYNLEDFLDHTYATFFKTETERKRKKTPALAMTKPGESVWEL